MNPIKGKEISGIALECVPFLLHRTIAEATHQLV